MLFLCCSKEDQKTGLCELQPSCNRPQHESFGREQDKEGAGASSWVLLKAQVNTPDDTVTDKMTTNSHIQCCFIDRIN